MLEYLSKKKIPSLKSYSIAVLLPCHNEALTVAQVVTDFQATLPEAKIYVYDNRSTDSTAEQAAAAGAVVRREPRLGKGNVIRRMFADIEADIYIMADGDNTYEVGAVRRLVEHLLVERLDMVVGVRRTAAGESAAYRRGHRSGNVFLTGFAKFLFGARLLDMLSGYRIFSRRFVKSFPALSSGFEIETEFTIHTLELKMPFAEEPTLYISRPPGSQSKLKTFKDGWRVLGTALLLFKEIRPFLFFGIIFLMLSLTSLALGIPIVETFLETGLVPRFPSAILAASIMLLAFLSLTCGLILDSVARGRREAKRIAYLAYPLPELD
ncbi:MULTISPECIES: glycosyltransferase family 2 protein [unclassified Coleofasciculus]|uniref:glycosyltransferase family 2 protein n=1 Tax=unclassified Coleofasciculus TaxID=2692782 RepID=UPI00187FC7A3|nr:MULTISPECIES: glycosyltransferase family 2 protein [unclassified Coleofasciculus]MBE9125810.1 glycosyltransferase [Coleofasciculus sp. LEGE 07081]MBE9149005.1 glycosyltransferase [Coleofasciculus sp. LEGE 07092]